jgi:hypothetical protein
MNAGAEGEMPVRSSLKIEFLGMLVRLRIRLRSETTYRKPVKFNK